MKMLLLSLLLIAAGMSIGIPRALGQDAPAAQPVVKAAEPVVKVAEPVVRAAEPVEQSLGPNGLPTASYRLKAKDTVNIRVFQEDDLDTTAKLDEDGVIFFPLLGKAKIGGETVQEATTTLESALHEYLLHPQVSLEILAYAKLHFTILGQVSKPGIFDFPDEGKLDLLEALGMAGGYTKIANPDKIIIKRMVDGKETIITVPGKRLLDKNNKTQAIPDILPNDTINVGEAIF
jgi:protein involved in polysaccharide export with SLBB domain